MNQNNGNPPAPVECATHRNIGQLAGSCRHCHETQVDQAFASSLRTTAMALFGGAMRSQTSVDIPASQPAAPVATPQAPPSAPARTAGPSDVDAIIARHAKAQREATAAANVSSALTRKLEKSAARAIRKAFKR